MTGLLFDTLELPEGGAHAAVPDAGRVVPLRGPIDLAGFRRAARALVLDGVPPEQVVWRMEDGATMDTGIDMAMAAGQETATDTGPDEAESRIAAGHEAQAAHHEPGLRMPRAFVTLCESLVMHRDPARFALMYRLLWRLAHEPTLRHDPLDADLMQAEAMARAVRRDIHKMRAFVRFRPVGDGRHVAWFEPGHHVVEANAPFFMRRFAQMRWAILTPDRCVEWDGAQLRHLPGADRGQAPGPDAGEALWLTYYEHIFNPARLKLATMAREMPRRYWPNLPEAGLIQSLADTAAGRASAMVAAEPSTPSHAYRPIVMTPSTAHGRRIARATAPGAEDARASIHSLAQLADAMQACRDCPIGAGATQAVPGEGPLGASHMLVGEQAGDQEDVAGHPFVGPAGRLLDTAMGELGWARDEVFVTNAVKHFKYELRGKRRMHKTPGQREMQVCSQWLDREIDIVKPRCFVALGATAARALLGRQVAITRERGHWLHERADGIPVFVTWHPSALLRMQDGDRDQAYEAWKADLAAARAVPAA